MTDVKDYVIAVPEERLVKLKKKLELVEFPQELENVGWEYGVPLKDIKSLTSYWVSTFSWRTIEAQLNKLPHFTTPITAAGFDAVDIHFIHQRSDVEGAIPLLFVHGWPGSFLEVTKMLPLLKGGEGRQAFHVVAPSLPNYGFSGHVTKKGFGLDKYAETVHKLMLKLGYKQYVTQGGDWGSGITRIIGVTYPEHCKACHFNLFRALEPSWTAENPKPEYTEKDIALLARTASVMQTDAGYFHIQSTRPATLGFALQDAPVGLLAWIYEKLRGWTDEYPWTPDEILTWVSIYYFSLAGPAASLYTYYEATHSASYNFFSLNEYISAPVGIAEFPKESGNSPRSWSSTFGNVVVWKTFEKGGHFAGWERPEDLAGALNEMFGKGGKAEGIVGQRSTL